MKDTEIAETAEQFLTALAVSFVTPGTIVERTPDFVIISFWVPEALEPDTVVDPPDVRVIVNIVGGSCQWVPQM